VVIGLLYTPSTAALAMDNAGLLCYQRGNVRGTPSGDVLFSQGAGGASDPEDFVIVQIFVRDNNVDQALKALKKKMQREGSFREMKRHVHYEKPSEKRARQKAEAVRRARKLARKRAQREGLIAAPKKPAPRGA
jgi:small subunit ribosomal protein S21